MKNNWIHLLIIQIYLRASSEFYFDTYNVLLGSVVFKCSRTCISERAASQYLSTFLTIFTATCLPPLLEKVEKKKKLKIISSSTFLLLFSNCNYFYFDPLYLFSWMYGLAFSFIWLYQSILTKLTQFYRTIATHCKQQ